ncbi:hypothetical protein D021_1722A, partial [Vibrio parahaemolyticus 10296]
MSSIEVATASTDGS